MRCWSWAWRWPGSRFNGSAVGGAAGPGGLRGGRRRWAGARWCCTATWRSTGWSAGWARPRRIRSGGRCGCWWRSPARRPADAELLDYEAELARIVAAVEPARKRGEAYVRVLNEGSLAAINAALSRGPGGVPRAAPVVSRPARRAAAGDRRRAAGPGHRRSGCWPRGCRPGPTCRWWCCRAAPPGWPPARSACTPALPPAGQAGPGRPAPEAGQRPGRGEGEAVLASFAAQLVGAGVPQVLAMQAPVTDRYATALSGEFYRRLATDASPDPLLALAGARRAAERDRQGAAAGLAAARPGGVGHPGADHPGAAAAAVQPAGAVRRRCTRRRPRCWPRAWWSGRSGSSSGGAARCARPAARWPGPEGGAGAARHRRGGQVHPGRRGAAVPRRGRRAWWSPGPGRSRWTTCSARPGRGCTWRRRRPRAARAWPGRR